MTVRTDLTSPMWTELDRLDRKGNASFDGRSVAALRHRGLVDGEANYPRLTADGREALRLYRDRQRRAEAAS